MKTKKELTEGFARNDEEKVFLASLLDKNEMAQDRGILDFAVLRQQQDFRHNFRCFWIVVGKGQEDAAS